MEIIQFVKQHTAMTRGRQSENHRLISSVEPYKKTGNTKEIKKRVTLCTENIHVRGAVLHAGINIRDFDSK